MREELQKLIKTAACSLNLGCEIDIDDVIVETPKNENLGDFSTNLALILGKRVEENPKLTKARLKLISAVKIVLGETLNLIGVEAPEKM